MAVDLKLTDIVSRDPERMSGEAVFDGTRVPVEILIDWLLDGASIDFFLANYPSVRREQVVASLEILRETLLAR